MRFKFSEAGDFAYRLGCGGFGFWLQVEPQPVGVVEAQCAKDGFFWQGVRFKHPDAPDDPAREYERRVLPFQFWKIKSGDERDLSESDLFVQDYLLHEAWRERDKPRPTRDAPPTLEQLVRNLQAHAKEHGWQDVDDPIAALLAWPLPEAPHADH